MSLAFILALISLVFAVSAKRAQDALSDRVGRLERMLEAERRRRVPSPAPTRAAEPTTPPPPPEPVAVRPAPPLAAPGPPPARQKAPAPPPPPTLPAIDWEQWLGVRGAAVLGGVALALAGIFFFRYSIEHDLIPPWLRVVMATLVGLGALAASERDGMRPDLVRTADALAGGGVAVLYAAFWASGPHYQLVPGAVAFVLMTAVTAACGLLSLRHSSLVIALLGLVGGFATPLLLASGADRPIGLFGYLLLLDAGVITLAKKRGWPFLAALGLCATLLYQLGWIATRMGADRLPLGIGILVLFMLVFSLSARGEEGRAREEWTGVGVPSALLPFAFALYFAARADLAPHFTSVAVLLVLLESAVLWLAATDEQPPVEIGAAAAAVLVMGVWLLGPARGAVDAWRANLIAVAIALPFQIAAELRPHDFRPMRTGVAAVTATSGLFLLLLLGGSSARTGAAPWPWLVGWLAFAGLLLRQSALSGRAFLCEPIGITLGMAMGGFAAAHAASRGYPEPPTAAALLLGLGLVGQAAALHRRGTALQAPTERGAALLALLLLQVLPLTMTSGELPPIAFMGASTGLGLLALLSATRGPCPRLSVAAVASTALVQTAWTWAHAHEPEAQIMIGAEVGAVVLFTSWPLLVGARAQVDPWLWRAAALAPPLWFLALRRLFVAIVGDQWIGTLPIVLALMTLHVASRANQTLAEGPIRRTALAWLGAVVLGLVTAAVPLQLEKQWITIAWALEAVAVTALWRRLDHPGLKWMALVLLTAVSLRLVANPALLDYYPRSTWPILNWLAYTYLIPALCAFATARQLAPDELGRVRSWEKRLYTQEQPIGAVGTALAGLVLVFVWLNLAIADWYATTPYLTLTFDRLPARDLSTSIAWIVYAMVLLVLGVSRRNIGLRWASMALVLLSIAKVFLHDLGELHDLYRVASLLGLAVSLLLVSVAYQRFVFPTAQPTEA